MKVRHRAFALRVLRTWAALQGKDTSRKLLFLLDIVCVCLQNACIMYTVIHVCLIFIVSVRNTNFIR
jgi:hypothetical protein